MKGGYKPGDKHKTGTPIDLGLTEQDSFDKGMKLRGETDIKTQRPTATTKKVSSDRGSFTDKC